MSFVAQFHNITLHITDTSRQVYERVRIKIAQHPEESGEHLFGRIIAYAHSWTPNLRFSSNLFDDRLPTLEERDVIDEPIHWIQVGCCERKKLERSLKSHPRCRHRIYFTHSDEVDAFCQNLKGSKTNWIEGVEFYLFDATFLDSLVSLGIMIEEWQLTFVDSLLHIQSPLFEGSTSLEPFSMWERFQEYITRG